MRKRLMIYSLTWMMLAGCARTAEFIPETQIESQGIMITQTQPALPEKVTVHEQVYNYKMLTDKEEDVAKAPCLTLFSDGTYGFTYDVLSSYFARGTYTVEGNWLKAVTSEGDKEFDFQIDQEGNLVFVKQESADIRLTDENMGVPVMDGSVFSLNPVESESSTMTATIKEILEGSVLVTSHEDSLPGAFYVEVPPTVDLSAFRGGETVTIIWYGLIRETSPAQITAMYMYQ